MAVQDITTYTYQDTFSLNNIEEDLKIVFEAFFKDKEKTTCTNCGTVMKSSK